MGPVESLLRRAAERNMRAPCSLLLAMNDDGEEREPNDPQATSWCMIGALQREGVEDDPDYSAAAAFLASACKTVRPVLADYPIASLNDHAPELREQAWDAAIARAHELGE